MCVLDYESLISTCMLSPPCSSCPMQAVFYRSVPCGYNNAVRQLVKQCYLNCKLSLSTVVFFALFMSSADICHGYISRDQWLMSGGNSVIRLQMRMSLLDDIPV